MITTGSKWFFGLGFVSLVLAAAYGWTTGGNGLGPLTVGYKGGVGDHLGYGILRRGAVVSLFLGFVATAVRDADAEAVGPGRRHRHRPGRHARPAPATGRRRRLRRRPRRHRPGVATPVFVFGLIVLGIVLVEWTVQAWADKATGDPETNRAHPQPPDEPDRVPGRRRSWRWALMVIAFSRVFLTLSAEDTVWVGAGLAAVIVGGGFLVASRPSVSSNVVVGLLVVAAVVIVGVGVAGGR